MISQQAGAKIIAIPDWLSFRSIGPKGAVAPVTVVLQPALIDTYLRENQATTNFGTATNLNIGRGGIQTTYRTLIKFDLSSIPGTATISSAVLSLFPFSPFRTGTLSRTFAVYRLLRAWVETEATWNIYSTGNNWQTAGGFGVLDCEQVEIGSRVFSSGEATNVFKDIVLTPATKADLDLGNGWMIKSTVETNSGLEWYFCSSNHATAANRPKLTITYTP